MMSFLLLVAYACSHHDAAAPIILPRTEPTISWQPDPNGRGTWGLLSSCVITMAICVWSAIHLSVPGQPPQGSWARFNYKLRRIRWTMMGLLAPELVVYCAWIQWSDARELSLRINADHTPKHKWTLSHGFLAGMGGYAIDTSDFFPEQSRIYLTTARALRLFKLGYSLPDLPKEVIADKSKADSLGETLVCLQASYMLVQVIGRFVAHVPVTLLEVNTLGHVLCALLMFSFWFHKPLDVRDPILLPDDWARSLVLLWFMRSDRKLFMQDCTGSFERGAVHRELDLLMLWASPDKREQIEYRFKEQGTEVDVEEALEPHDGQVSATLELLPRRVNDEISAAKHTDDLSSAGGKSSSNHQPTIREHLSSEDHGNFANHCEWPSYSNFWGVS